MRKINLIVIHCSATREDRTFTEQDLEVCHRRRGFNGTGYHFYIRKNGDVKATRPIEKIGAHVRGFNLNSLGIGATTFDTLVESCHLDVDDFLQ